MNIIINYIKNIDKNTIIKNLLKTLLIVIIFVILFFTVEMIKDYYYTKNTNKFILNITETLKKENKEEEIQILEDEFNKTKYNNKAILGFYLVNLYQNNKQYNKAFNILKEILKTCCINKKLKDIALYQLSSIALDVNNEKFLDEFITISNKYTLKNKNNIHNKILINRIIALKLRNKKNIAEKEMKKVKLIKNNEYIDKNIVNDLNNFLTDETK